MNPSELKTFIETKIQASKALNFSIDKIDAQEALLSSPLETHLNHKGTAFGGNLYALCTVAAYSLVLNLLVTHNLYTDDIVIAEGQIKYLKPVASQIQLKARFDSEKDSRDIIASVQSGKRIPILIRVDIFSDGSLCADFKARFAMKLG